MSVRLGPLMTDIEGTSLSRAERAMLRDRRVGGVILFERNFESRRQLAQLTRSIHALREPPLLIAVDHEGGRVQRFRTGFTRLPAMRTLGEAWQRGPMNALRAATATGFVLAGELRALGVDLSFTPVLDLDHGSSSVIGDRAFSRNPRVVTQLAGALILGLGQAGMAACGKHFPGHGHVRGDSHHECPVDRRSLARIMSSDAAPYDWLAWPTLAAVMPAHVVYPKVDANNPAGFSRIWLDRILRRRLGFDGAIFSDDLGMAGAAGVGTVEQRADAALAAGCDMILICNAPPLRERLLAKPRLRANPDSARRLSGLIPRLGPPAEPALARARKLVRALAAA